MRIIKCKCLMHCLHIHLTLHFLFKILRWEDRGFIDDPVWMRLRHKNKYTDWRIDLMLHVEIYASCSTLCFITLSYFVHLVSTAVLMLSFTLLGWRQLVKVCKNHCFTMITTLLAQLLYWKSWLPMDAKRYYLWHCCSIHIHNALFS